MMGGSCGRTNCQTSFWYRSRQCLVSLVRLRSLLASLLIFWRSSHHCAHFVTPHLIWAVLEQELCLSSRSEYIGLIVSRLGLPGEYDYWPAEYSPNFSQKSNTTGWYTYIELQRMVRRKIGEEEEHTEHRIALPIRWDLTSNVGNYATCFLQGTCWSWRKWKWSGRSNCK